MEWTAELWSQFRLIPHMVWRQFSAYLPSRNENRRFFRHLRSGVLRVSYAFHVEGSLGGILPGSLPLQIRGHMSGHLAGYLPRHTSPLLGRNLSGNPAPALAGLLGPYPGGLLPEHLGRVP